MSKTAWHHFNRCLLNNDTFIVVIESRLCSWLFICSWLNSLWRGGRWNYTSWYNILLWFKVVACIPSSSSSLPNNPALPVFLTTGAAGLGAGVISSSSSSSIENCFGAGAIIVTISQEFQRCTANKHTFRSSGRGDLYYRRRLYIVLIVIIKKLKYN